MFGRIYILGLSILTISLLNGSNFIRACKERMMLKQREYSLQEFFANSMLRKR